VELAAHYGAAGPPRGEVAVVVGPPPAAGTAEAAVADNGDEAEVERALERALRDMAPAAAASAVAAATGRPRRDVYRRALALRGKRR
jgi:16S rRNA (cytidine1402-2'-O)-methyltransferase